MVRLHVLSSPLGSHRTDLLCRPHTAGDNLRTGLTRDLGFTAADRGESVRRAAEVAALFNEAGVITMVTLISPYRKAAAPAHPPARSLDTPQPE